MEIHELSSASELEQSNQVTLQTKREAYGHIISDEAFEREKEKGLSIPLEERYANLQAQEQSVLLLADDDGDVVGNGYFIWDSERTSPHVDANESELRMLHVHPDRWGEGIGTQLLEEGLERLPESSERLVLNTFEENEIGKSFYESRGFDEIGTTDFEVGGESYPAVVLALDL